MRTRASIVLFVSLALASCASGFELGYAVPGAREATYVVGDTVAIGLEGLGQPLEIGARSAATYGLRYEPSAEGIGITATIEAMSADVVTPMTEPMSLDEAALEGAFSFRIDGRGRVTSMASPQASGAGGQVFAAPLIAHALFPRLPGSSVAVGDSWVDSVTYREEGDAGETRITSTLTYTVVGESEAAGRTLLEVDFTGPASLRQNLSIEGAGLTQESELEVAGRLLWDADAGLLQESEATMEGPGRVRVALMPAELGTNVRWRTRVRLENRR